MKNPNKVIKVISIILIIWGIFGLILGVLMVAGGGIGTSYALNNADTINSAVADNADLNSSLSEFNNTYGTDVDASGVVGVVTIAVIILGVSAVIGALLDIISAVFGFKAAKGKNANPAYVMGIINIVFAILSFVLTVCYDGVSANMIISLIISLVIPVIYTYAAYQLKNKPV